MHGAGVWFAGGVISAPDTGDQVAQAMVLKKLFDSTLCVIADDGTDHTGAVKLAEQFL